MIELLWGSTTRMASLFYAMMRVLHQKDVLKATDITAIFISDGFGDSFIGSNDSPLDDVVMIGFIVCIKFSCDLWGDPSVPMLMALVVASA